MALFIGGGRKLLLAWRARKAIARLGEPNVTAEEIEAVAEHGRAGVGSSYESSARPTRTRNDRPPVAPGAALASGPARRRGRESDRPSGVPRDLARPTPLPSRLRAEVPIVVTYEVPFLNDDGRHVGPANLEWSHRVTGPAAALDEFSPWTAGNGRVACSIFPGDFETNGPHRLVLQTRVRTAGLTDSWAIDLPQVPFNFEFDPILRLDAILTLADATRTSRSHGPSGSSRLSPPTASPRHLPLGGEWTMRNPPRVAVATPLAADLAHAISIEFEGLSGRFPAGRLILSGQGTVRLGSTEAETVIRRFELRPDLIAASHRDRAAGFSPGTDLDRG